MAERINVLPVTWTPSGLDPMPFLEATVITMVRAVAVMVVMLIERRPQAGSG